MKRLTESLYTKGKSNVGTYTIALCTRISKVMDNGVVFHLTMKIFVNEMKIIKAKV